MSLLMGFGRSGADADLQVTAKQTAVMVGPQSAELAMATPGTVAIQGLSLNLLVRLCGVDPGHVKMLTELTTPVPPIVVNQGSLSVIDGVHRVLAARARGETQINALLIDCSDAEALILSVKLNSGHGLPLSRNDRRAAVERIVESFPSWSDRRIAALAGVSSKTVAAVRLRSVAETPQLVPRIGRDGRARPLDSSKRRARALELLQQKPDASIREIASVAEVSVSTASGIRREWANKTTASVAPQRTQERTSIAPQRTQERTERVPQERGQSEDQILNRLRADPALNSTSMGRVLLRLLFVNSTGIKAGEQLVRAAPAHRRQDIAEHARKIAEHWSGIAEKLDPTECGSRETG